MGYRTPNIGRLANEGFSFTDYYGQQSGTGADHDVWLSLITIPAQ